MNKHIKHIIKKLFLAIATATTAGVAALSAETPRCDFSFTTAEGVETSLYETVSGLQPDAQVRLLLFDPDCGECHETERRLASDSTFNAGIADRSAAVIAIYPTDGILEPDDPNLTSYLNRCNELPREWIVGIDNGSVFETDACIWETLPLLLEFSGSQLLDRETRPDFDRETQTTNDNATPKLPD